MISILRRWLVANDQLPAILEIDVVSFGSHAAFGRSLKLQPARDQTGTQFDRLAFLLQIGPGAKEDIGGQNAIPFRGPTDVLTDHLLELQIRKQPPRAGLQDRGCTGAHRLFTLGSDCIALSCF